MARKRKKSKYLSLVIVSENQKTPRNYRIHTALLKSFSVLGIVVLVLIIAGFATYWKVASLALDNNRLQEENFKLMQSLQRMDKIQEELTAVKGFEKQLKSSLSGYVTIEKDTKADSSELTEFDFAKLSGEQKRTFFKNIPTLQPADGFLSRGYDSSLMLAEAHLGLDISAPTGTPVKAPADGVVIFSGWTVDGGNVLIIEHGYGYKTLYKHNERNLVHRLERVNQGQIIALVGNTGKISSGPHLHYEVWQHGKPLDPANYLNKEIKTNS